MSPDDFRELHHFETEQKLENVLRYLDNCEEYGDEIDPDDIRNIIGEL